MVHIWQDSPLCGSAGTKASFGLNYYVILKHLPYSPVTKYVCMDDILAIARLQKVIFTVNSRLVTHFSALIFSLVLKEKACSLATAAHCVRF